MDNQSRFDIKPYLFGAALGLMATAPMMLAALVVAGAIYLVDDQTGELELAAVLHALSDPMRLRIVAELAASGGERNSSAPQPAIKRINSP